MFKQRYWIPSHWHIYVLFAVVTIGFSALLLAANKVYSQSAMQNSKPIFVDEILPVPNPLPASPSDGFNLVGPSRDYLTLSGGSAATLSGIDAAAFSKLNIPNALSPVKFYYQRSIGEFADQEYIDGAFSEEHSARLAAAVGSMLGVLDSRMNELMTCAVPRTNSDVPQAYRANNSTTALDGDRLASDLRLMFFSPPKDVHIAIGAFGNSQRSDGSFISGVTWSQILYGAPIQATDLSAISRLNQVLIGININTNQAVWQYLPKDIMASVVFHEILHNFGFNHTSGGQSSNDIAVYRNRAKAILTLEDCMAELVAAENQPIPPVVVPAQDILAVLTNALQQAEVQTTYPGEAHAFAAGLVAHLNQFQLADLGITEKSMRDALARPDAGLRINATVERVWGDWLPYGPRTVQTDPATQKLTPFRVLVIRLIQGRHLTLTTSEQHALYNLMTRPEPTENWRKSMNGIIGSINQGSFQVVFHTGNNPLTTDQPVPVVPVEPIAQPQKNPPITTTTNDPTLGNRPIGQISLVTDFENFGAWHRGDEAWGTFSQSAEQSTSGQYSGKFVYNFPAVENNYIIFQHTINIGRPDALQVQVYGDGSTHFLNLWVQDASGQIWQFTFGRINHVGWQPMLAPLDLGLGWPNQAVGNTSAPAMTYPLRFYAVVLDGHASNQSFSGAIYIDDLMAVTFADSPNGVPINESPALPVDPSTSAPPQSTATVTSPTLNVRSGPGATFQVVGKVQKGQVLSVLERDAATGWLRVETPVGIGWVSGNFVKLAK